MDLNTATEIVKNELDKSNIVVVTSNHGIFLLDNESEIANVEEYAKNNNLKCFIVKNEKSEVTTEDKPKKKK